MEPAVYDMQRVLEGIRLGDMTCPVVFNVDAQTHAAGEIRKLLLQQLVSPVRWTDSVVFAIQSGVDTFIELGPGRVLTGLVKRINKAVRLFNVNDPATLEQLRVLIQ